MLASLMLIGSFVFDLSLFSLLHLFNTYRIHLLGSGQFFYLHGGWSRKHGFFVDAGASPGGGKGAAASDEPGEAAANDGEEGGVDDRHDELQPEGNHDVRRGVILGRYVFDP